MTASLVAYLSAVTLTEPAFAARGEVWDAARPFGVVAGYPGLVGLASLRSVVTR